MLDGISRSKTSQHNLSAASFLLGGKGLASSDRGLVGDAEVEFEERLTDMPDALVERADVQKRTSDALRNVNL
jgi:hypothetical protein